MAVNIISRRNTLKKSLAFFMSSSLGLTGCRLSSRGQFIEYPFTLGVASGDPLSDSVVLWTRLAPRPDEPHGGLTLDHAPVSWQLSEDEHFKNILRHGVEIAKPGSAFSIHADVKGLQPSRVYFYRFIAGGVASPTGRTRTAPSPDAFPGDIRIAQAGCQNFESGYYTAYRHMASDDLDLIIHTGDYIYEGGQSPHGLRLHQDFRCKTLEQYRRRYALYKSDLDLQAAHAAHPFSAVWDDHEIKNNWHGAIAGSVYQNRKSAALKAWWEHMPVRPTQSPSQIQLKLYRSLTFGRTVSFNFCDTRQFRTPQPCGGQKSSLCSEAMNSGAQMFGQLQEEWLLSRLRNTSSIWNVIIQGVPITEINSSRDPNLKQYSMDKWDGYRVPRRRLLSFIESNNIPGPISLAGDLHRHLASELHVNFSQPKKVPVAHEFVNTSISSGGDGKKVSKTSDRWLRNNQHIKFVENQRGYLRHQIRPSSWNAVFMSLDSICRRYSSLRVSREIYLERKINIQNMLR